jgi:hypothetical protein
MQPATAEIERCCRTDAGRPGPPAEPQPRLHNQAVDARVGEPPPRCDSSRPAANDRHFGIADGHTPFRDDRIQKPAPILTMRGVQCPDLLELAPLDIEISPPAASTKGAAISRAFSRFSRRDFSRCPRARWESEGARLRGLPFVDVVQDGLDIHDAVRGAVAAALKLADPPRFHRYQRAAEGLVREGVVPDGVLLRPTQ